MQTSLPIPTIDDIDRIRNTTDPVIRNLLITQCYYELSAVLASRTGLSANWCTFATWASKQAGQTIRKEDLMRLFEHRLYYSPSVMQATEGVTAAIHIQGRNQHFRPGNPLLLETSGFRSAVDRASDAVSRGNKKVFEEIGYAFARFYQMNLDEPQAGGQQFARFCEELRPGEPPEGQEYLRRAFSRYAQALVEKDPKTRAELVLLANIEIGFHEQTRLQPEIAESLDAGFVSFLDFVRPVFRSLFPLNGWLHLAHLYLMRLIGRPTVLDLAIQALLTEARIQLRQAITEIMMSISLPSGEVLRLGKDLAAEFPDSLKQIANPDLVQFLQKNDLTPDSVNDSGALDWADLSDRLNFIVDFFRCYQESQTIFEPPFTPEQVAAFQSGKVPAGQL